MASMNFDCDLVCSSIKPQQLQVRKVIKGEFDAEPAKCRYNAGVLVSDWFEKRTKYEPPKDDWHTVYDETYTCKKNNDLQKDRIASKEIKHKSGQGVGGEFLIEYPGDTFHNNYTTSYDLVFRILPKGLCGPQIRSYHSRKDLWLPQTDMSKNFGSLTTYSPPDFCAHLKESSGPVKRFVKPKGITNLEDKPYLCHLDIDPELPFRPHL